MNTTTRNEVLASIDSMNEVVQESELDVLCSLLDQVDKASVILESYSGDAIDAFAIYQEADEAVQQGDPAGQAGAEAKKKNVFVKIWEFIKNLLGSIGNFIKRCWNGTVVPAAETVSDKTADIINKIADKDENWIKEHGTEIGLTAGGITAAIAILAIIKKDAIKKAIDTFVAKLKLFFTNFKGLITFDFTGAGIKTNIKFDSVVNVIKSSVKIFNGAKNLASNNMTVDQLMNELTQLQNAGDTLVQDEREFAFNEVLKQIEPIRLEFTNANINVDSNPGDINVNDADENKAKQVGSLLSKLGGAFVAISTFFKSMLDKVSGLISKSKDLGEGSTDQGSNDQAPAENTEGESTETSETPADETVEGETENASGESGQTNVGEPGKGMSYTANQVKAFLNNVGKNDVEVPENPEGTKMIRYKDGDPLTFVYHADEGKYYYESAEEEVSEDDDVVTESHTGYYFK